MVLKDRFANSEGDSFALAELPRNGGPYLNLEKTSKSTTRMSVSAAIPSSSDGSDQDKSVAERNASYSNESGLLFRDGQLVKQPAPTADPRDPINLSFRRKVLAALFMCCFGALAAAAELILGSLLPVFFLEYSGISAKLIAEYAANSGGLPAGTDPWKALSELPNAPPVWKVQLLASMPVLIMGLANLFLVPLAIAIGRRPVMLGSGVIAIGGAVWAGFSRSLNSHIAARCIQAIGAGTVESLIPFIIQDMVFVHQRNTWISFVFAAQGIIIVGLGIGTPYIIVDMSWRWIYYITSALAGFFLIGTFVFLPETKWNRSREEMNGVPRHENVTVHAPRTWKEDLKIFHGRSEWSKGLKAFNDTIWTFFYPHIFFVTCINSAMLAATFAAFYNVTPTLLTQPWSWSFFSLGLCLLPVMAAAIVVALLTGLMADWTANWAARARGKRVPENQLLNLILPIIATIIGAVLYGVSGSRMEDFHWAVMLLAIGFLAFGFMGTNTIGAVYVLESYPHLAGPALVNIASFRCLIAFVLSYRVTEWVAELGALNTMMIYVGIIVFIALLIPVVWMYGAAWRKRWPATHRGDSTY